MFCTQFFGAAGAYARPFGSALGALIEPRRLPAVQPYGAPARAVQPHDFKMVADHAVDALLSEFRRLCRDCEQAQTAEFTRLQTFIAKLKEEFEIAVVTLNYDNVLYRSLFGIETGFDPQPPHHFREERIFERSTWPCMLHLHGSVHFDMPIAGPDMVWQPNINAEFAQNAFGRGGEGLFNPEGLVLPASVIVAGYAKTMQILRRPFRTYYAELDRLAFECDALLIAGYGFGDQHLNIAFEKFRDHPRANRPRPVVLIERLNEGERWWSQESPAHYRLAQAIFGLFRTDPAPMYEYPIRHYGIRSLNNFIENMEFARLRDPPLAIWHNGMLEACNNATKVIEVLHC